MERGAGDRGRPPKYVKTLAKTQEAPDRCLSRKRQGEEIMMRMYNTHGTRCHLLPYLVTAWDLQPTRKRAVHTTCSVVSGQESKVLRSMYCTIHELQSLVLTIHTLIHGVLRTARGGGKGRY